MFDAIQVHIPKTGGAYVKSSVDPINPSNGFHQFRSAKIQKFVKNYDIPFVFAFLRDPVERAVSVFYSLNQASDPTRRGSIDSKKKLAMVFYVMTQAQGLTCDAFWAAMLKDNGHLIRQLRRFIPHFKSQSHWLHGDKHKLVRLYNSSNMGPEVDRLLSDLGRPASVAKAPVGKSMNVEGELSAETIKSLRSWYAGDCKLLEGISVGKEATPAVVIPEVPLIEKKSTRARKPQDRK
jgi:hypothetical protein